MYLRLFLLVCVSFAVSQPTNDLCNSAVSLSSGSPYSGTSVSATDETGITSNCLSTHGFTNGVWFTFFSGTNNRVTISICGGSGSWDSMLRLFSGTCGALNCIAKNDDACASLSEISNQDIYTATTYYILLAGFSAGSSGTYTITMTLSTLIPPNDVCASAVSLSSGVPVSRESVHATDDTGIASNCGATDGFGKGLWFTFNSGGFTEVTVSVCGGASWNTYLRIFSGSCGSLSCIARNDDGCSTQSVINNQIISAATTYYVLLAGFSSESGVFTITMTLGNDLCTSPISLLSGVPYSGDSTGATDEDNTAPNCGITFGLSKGVWFTFNSGTNNRVTVSLCGTTGWDTVLRLFSGSCGSLSCVTSDDDGCSIQSVINNLVIVPSTTYYVLLSSYLDYGSFVITMTLSLYAPPNDQCSAPSVLNSGIPFSGDSTDANDDIAPDCGAAEGFTKGVWFFFNSYSFNQVSLSVCGGASWNTYLRLYSGSSCGSLSCVARDDDSCSSQSLINNQAIAPQTLHYVFLAGLNTLESGPYTISMTLGNDLCTTAISLSSGVPYSGNNFGASHDTGITSNCGPPDGFGRGVWFSFNSGAFDRVSVSVCGANWDTYLRIFSGTCGSLTCVVENDDGCGSIPISFASAISNQAISPSTTYYVLLAGYSVETGPFTITMTLGNDLCASAISLSSGIPFSGSNIGASDDTGITSDCGNSSGFSNGVWFSFNSGTFDRVSVSVCGGASWNTYLRIFSGSCGTLSCVGGNDDGCSAQSVINNQPISQSTPYLILLSGFGGTGSFTITMTLSNGCGNGQCEALETSGSCSVDCTIPSCGNNLCDSIETFSLCPHDCALSSCGNNLCEAIETNTLCPHDCTIPTCGNPIGCDSLETFSLCPHDCTISSCGNNQCEAIETYALCPHDCAISTCGNPIGCDSGETFSLCPHDCTLTNCGNNQCEATETNTLCPHDCTISTCGNGVCESNEQAGACPADCSPANDDCSNSILLGDGVLSLGTTVDSTDDSNSISSFAGCSSGPVFGYGNVWYEFNSGSATFVTISTCSGGSTATDTVLTLARGSCGALTCVAQNDDDLRCPFGSGLSKIQAIISQNTQYKILVSTVSQGSFSVALTLSGGGVGGDPHVFDFVGNKYEIPEEYFGKYFGLYSDSHLTLNIKIATNSFVSAIGATFSNPISFDGNFTLIAKLEHLKPVFTLNDIEFSLDTTDLPKWISVTEPSKLNQGVLSELQKYQTIQVNVFEMFTIVGGYYYRHDPNVPAFGFFNVQVLRYDTSHSDKNLHGLLQAHSHFRSVDEVDINSYIRNSLI